MRKLFNRKSSLFLGLFASLGCLSITSCDDKEYEMPRPFQLRFAPVVDGKMVGCSEAVTGLGSEGNVSVGLSDLRFYVSNFKLWDAAGNEVPAALDANEFQFHKSVGGKDYKSTLIDLTGNTEGTCADSSIAYAEGTPRVNNYIRGTTFVGEVKRVTFDIGIPQPLMRDIIALNTEEGAPSPFAEMYWSWASGYRYFLFNFAVNRGTEKGDGYLHIGSRDCGVMGQKALADREQCTFVNIPQVSVNVENFEHTGIGIDLRKAMAGVDFEVPRDMSNPAMGTMLGVSCHSSPKQADCGAFLRSFGLDMATGAADASQNSIFVPVMHLH